MNTHTHPRAFVPAIEVSRIVDAIDHLQAHLGAYEAIEQMVCVERLNAETHLPLLKRDDFGMLLCIVNLSIRKLAEEAREIAATAMRSQNQAQP